MSISLATIEAQAAATAAARDDLAQAIGGLQAAIDALKAEHAPALRAHLSAYNTQQEALRGLLEDAPELFQRPRTVVFHGLKLGYQKGKGGLAIEDDARCVQLIKRHFADQAEVLIRTTEKPARDALAQLSAAELKRLGVHIVQADDQVVLKAVDGDIDKLIKALTGDPLLTEDA